MPMSRSRLIPAVLGLALCMLVIGPQATAAPQNADELARENERLKTEIQDLKSKLDAALKRIETLEGTSSAGTSSTGTTGLPVAAKVLDKTPEGVVKAIRVDYVAAVAAGEIPAPGDASDQASRIRHRRATEKWVLDRERRFKVRDSWPVVIDEVKAGDGKFSIAILRGRDPETDEAAGQPFEVRFPAKMQSRIQREMVKQDPEKHPIHLDVIFVPNLRLRPDRMEQGPFHDGSFIGPMVESDWELSFRNLGRAAQRERPS